MLVKQIVVVNEHFQIRGGITTPLPQLQSGERKKGKDQRRDPEASDDFGLFPPLQLEVVVNGRHAEDSLTPRLKRYDLNDDGERFQHENAANERQQQLLLDDDSDTGYGATQRQ